MGYLERGVSYLTCLFTENRTKQALLSGQLRLALRCYLADKDIAGTHLSADADDAALVEILKRIVTNAGNISCDLLRAKFGITRFCLVLGNMNGCVDILFN